MHATTNEAKRSALRDLHARQQASGRVISPWARRALEASLPVKDMTRSAR